MNMEFAIELAKAGTVEDQREVLGNHICAFRYDRFAYAMVPTSPTKEMGEYISVNNLNPEWMRLYHERELHKCDPLAIHCLSEVKPLFWSTVHERAEKGKLPASQSEVMNLAWEQGYRVGVTIPLKQVGAYRAGISLIAEHTGLTEAHKHTFFKSQKPIIEICDMFHARLDRRLLSANYYQLTKRETEVLELLSHGYLDKEIAHETGRSIHTIEKQIRSARLRLQSATRTQAVAKAVALGVLD